MVRGEIFGEIIEIFLYFLDDKVNMELLEGFRMEVMDLAYGFFREIIVILDVFKVF